MRNACPNGRQATHCDLLRRTIWRTLRPLRNLAGLAEMEQEVTLCGSTHRARCDLCHAGCTYESHRANLPVKAENELAKDGYELARLLESICSEADAYLRRPLTVTSFLSRTFLDTARRRLCTALQTTLWATPELSASSIMTTPNRKTSLQDDTRAMGLKSSSGTA